MAKAMEKPLVFDICGSPVLGVLHQPSDSPEVGIIMLAAGGPQYHVGCSRQLLTWARKFSDAGFAVLRFDYRGMGDSGGEFKGFEEVDGDLRAAVDQLLLQSPSIKQVVFWGGCNAASAILMYVHHDPRVKQVIALNPWIRTQAAEAQVQVKYYYLQRLTQKSFWLKVLSGKLNPLKAAQSLLAALAKMRGAGLPVHEADSESGKARPPVSERIRCGLEGFNGEVLLLLSGKSLEAQQFDATVNSTKLWKQTMKGVRLTRQELPDAGHTFATRESQDAAFDAALNWLRRSV